MSTRKNKFSYFDLLTVAIIFSLSLVLILQACKKTDFSTSQTNRDFTDNFFAAKASLDPLIRDAIEKMKRQNEKRNFVNALPTDIGLPIWEKMKILEMQQGAARGDDSTGHAFLVIPFSPTGLYLDGLLVAVPSADSLDYMVTYYSSEFLYGVCHKTSKNVPQAENLLGLFMMMENYLFERTDFYHVPIDIFPTNAREANDSTKIASLAAAENEEGGGGNNRVITGCSIVPSGIHHPNEEGPCDYMNQCGYCSAIYCIINPPDIPVPPTGGGGTGTEPPNVPPGTPPGGGGGGGGTCTGCPSPPPDCKAPFYIEDPCPTDPPTDPPTEDTVFNPCLGADSLTSSDSFKSYLKELKDSLNSTNNNREYGYMLFRDALGAFGNTSAGLLYGPANKLGLTDFNNHYLLDGMVHSHFNTNTDSTRGLQVFSPDDLWTLCATFVATNIKNPATFVMALVTPTTQYLMKIENFTMFREWAVKFVPGTMRRHYRDFEERGILKTNSDTLNEKRFLKMIQEYDSGLKLFRGNSSFTTWQPIKYNPITNSVENAPCP